MPILLQLEYHKCISNRVKGTMEHMGPAQIATWQLSMAGDKCSSRTANVSPDGAGGEPEAAGDLGRRGAAGSEVESAGAPGAGQVEAGSAQEVRDRERRPLGLQQAGEGVLGAARQIARLRDVQLPPAPRQRQGDRGGPARDVRDFLQDAGEGAFAVLNPPYSRTVCHLSVD